jgi:para-aminobenzoate synthetase / 4-amino-4-deoxychorismate lyase
MPLPCFALLDDNSTSPNAAGTVSPSPRSRLYTGYHSSLRCDAADALPDLLIRMQAALQQGLHAVALFSYELGAPLQGIAAHAATISNSSQPPAEILLFTQCQRLSVTETGDWLQQQDGEAIDSIAGIANIRANVDAARFSDDIDRIRTYIAAGDTYQVNYTYRLHFDAYGTPLRLYKQLRTRQPVPYGALICLPDQRCILSFSPELFVRHQQGLLYTQPMKGTAPAAPGLEPQDVAENRRRAAQLAQDEKNRAENLMIVDLLRNDLGRIAVNGSVAVPQLFSVNRFGQVLQMTSTITARLRPDASLYDVVTALYPCGSITGAPKRRTMQIIRELEAAPRGLYTGAIGWFEAAGEDRLVGDFCLSVPIRTLQLQAPENGVRAGEMGVGAGIVYDSRAADEYAECRLKASFLTGLESSFSLFETLHASRAEGCRHLELHLARLHQSATYFNFSYDEQAIRTALAQACRQLPSEASYRLRLDLHRNGELRLQQGLLQPLPTRVKAFIAPQPSSSDDLFLRHKNSRRTVYDQAWQAAEQRGGFDMLFFNQRGELTEGGRSNVFVKLDGRWYTPPLTAGVLAGVMRTVLLQDPAWAASERTLHWDDLRLAQQVVLCNALRGVIEVDLDFDQLQ